MRPTRSHRPTRRLAWTFLALAMPALAVADGGDDDPRLARVLESFDRVQASIRTLSAEFTETTHSVMLLDPAVSEGRFYLTKPAAIRWEYSSPEAMQFIIEDDTYTGYFPDRKRAERKNIRRWSDHLFRFFGVGQGSDELKKFYRIRMPDEQPDDSILLILEPKRKRARKRVELVHFWLDPETYLPARIQYDTAEGSGRVVEFRSIEMNPDLAAALYEIELPADVTVTDGFSGLPDFGADRPR